MYTVHDYLDSVDFSHPMTTARRHIEMICGMAYGKTVLELGSHAGISATAIALAGGIVTSVDLCDTISEQQRIDYWKLHGVEITPWAGTAAAYLEHCEKYPDVVSFDIIFHDAMHGDRAFGEYMACANICGTLVIHDFEQLSPAGQVALRACTASSIEEADHLGRVLFIARIRD